MSGTLIVSRKTNLFPYWKTELERIGFKNIIFTCLDKDGLNSKIREDKPKLVLVESSFYFGCTPFMMKELLKNFPMLNIAAVNIQDYPDELAMKFITNGVKSYVNMLDGIEEFKRGLEKIRDGKQYIADGVQARMELRLEYPKPAGNITERHIEVIRLICNGFKDSAISKTLAISRTTIYHHKTEIFTSLNVQNSLELITTALNMEIVNLDEMIFYPNDFLVNPKPEKQTSKRRKL